LIEHEHSHVNSATELFFLFLFFFSPERFSNLLKLFNHTFGHCYIKLQFGGSYRVQFGFRSKKSQLHDHISQCWLFFPLDSKFIFHSFVYLHLFFCCWYLWI